MLDPITLDQLRTFVAVADTGSFSAAGRRLQRVQSAVSHAIANLELSLGVTLFDRSTRVPALTEQGRVLLAAARRVCADADALRQVADGLSGGLEPSVSLCVDAVFPLTALVDLCREFAGAFPTVELCVHTESMSAVSERVLDGSCHLGVVGPAARTEGLSRRHLTSVRMVPVVAKEHALAQARERLTTEILSEHVQLVLRERAEAPGPDQAVLSARVWRVGDLHTKLSLLRAGLGWGNMPEHMVRADLAAGALARLGVLAWGEDEHVLPLSVVHRPDLAAGPAIRWTLERLAELCVRDVQPPQRKRR